jgi:hypothetical protein
MNLFGRPNVKKMEVEGDIDGLIKALGYQKDALVRIEAAYALHRIGGTRAVEPLIALLKDDDKIVRQSVAKVLGEIGDPRAVEPLIAALKDFGKRSDWVRRRVVLALGNIGDDRAVEPLVNVALRDFNWDVRLQAVRALGMIGDTNVVELLIAKLQDKDEHIRKAVSELLGKIGGPDAEQALRKYTQSKQEEQYQKVSDVTGWEYIGKVGGRIPELTLQLVSIGESDGFLCTDDFHSTHPRGPFDETNRHIRTRQIGIQLNEIGGLEQMTSVHNIVTYMVGTIKGRELEAAWDGIGNWKCNV